jgi:hypothetical protein
MCNGVCSRFKKELGVNFYCQDCAKFISKSNVIKESKINGRMRCSCCNGLVRNKARYRTIHGFKAIH